MIRESLLRLGFSPSEIKVYLCLFEKGVSYSNKISRDVGLNRSNVYEALDRLVAKGVVSFVVKDKVKWFETGNFNNVLKLVESKELELDVLRKDLIKKFSELNVCGDKHRLEASIFVGKKGLRVLFEEILSIGKPIFLIASKLQFQEFFGPYFDLWHKKRISRKIKQKSIFPESFKGKLKKRKYLQYKFVESKFVNPTTTIICGDLCVFINWEGGPVAIRIESSEVTSSHKNYFDGLWGLVL